VRTPANIGKTRDWESNSDSRNANETNSTSAPVVIASSASKRAGVLRFPRRISQCCVGNVNTAVAPSQIVHRSTKADEPTAPYAWVAVVAKPNAAKPLTTAPTASHEKSRVVSAEVGIRYTTSRSRRTLTNPRHGRRPDPDELAEIVR
jgi:hypothetical protein